MRLAVSAATAMSGLLLLGLAIYGQPALYVHKAREQLDAWVGPSSADTQVHGPAMASSAAQSASQTPPNQAAPSAGPTASSSTDGSQSGATVANGDAEAQRLAQLQREVSALRAQLAQRQADAAAANQSGPDQAAASPATVTAPPATPPTANATPDNAAPQPAPAVVGSATSPQTNAGPDVASTSPPPSAAPAPQSQAPASVAQPVMKLAVPANPPAADLPAMTVQPQSPPRRETHDANETSVAAMSLPRPPLPPLKSASPNIPAAKPGSRPAEPTESDMQSVLARLRQSGPSQAAPSATAQPNQQSARAPDRATRPADQPALPRLTAARAALGAGRMDDAVRLLQAAQLQLVFRPVDTSAANPEGVGQGASDVARALEALSGNNVPNGMRFIDQAIGDLNGNRTNSTAALSDLRSTGYAPAYPPR